MNTTIDLSVKRAAVSGFVSLALFLAPAGVQGQAVAVSVDERETEALELENRARKLHDRKNKWGEAAQLYRDAARLREPGDPLALRDRVWAGRLSYYVGNERQAYRDLLEAADLALETGDVIVAAHTYLDAGWVAHRMGWDADAHELADRARRLSLSPLLASAEKSRVLGRLAPEDEQQTPSSLQP